MVQRQRGELESLVLAALWDSPGGLTGNEIRDTFADPKPAVTTILTVLDRLRDKGVITRDKTDGRGFRYSAVTARHDTIVNSMVKTLTESTDRTLALLHFAGNLTESDRAILRQALDAK